MRRRALALVLLLALPLAACGDDDDDASSSSSSSSTSSSSTTSTTGTSTSTTSTTAPEDAAVTPSTEGIEVDGASFAFGGDAGEVVDAVTAALGEPAEESDVPECPAGPASGVGWEDVQLVIQGGAFVGWSMGELSQVSTSDGLSIGSTLQDVRDRYPDATVDPESTIGIEVYAESVGLSGLVSEDAPTGTVTSLWAGIVCIFR